QTLRKIHQAPDQLPPQQQEYDNRDASTTTAIDMTTFHPPAWPPPCGISRSIPMTTEGRSGVMMRCHSAPFGRMPRDNIPEQGFVGSHDILQHVALASASGLPPDRLP